MLYKYIYFFCLTTCLISCKQKEKRVPLNYHKNFDVKKVEEGYKQDHKIITSVEGKKFYFKPSHDCSSLVPLTTFYLSHHLNLNLVPYTFFTKVGKVKGVAMTFLEGYEDLRNSGEKLLDTKVSRMGDIDLIRYVSGAYDNNPSNYMKKGEDLKMIDNGAHYIQLGFYGDFPYEGVSENMEAQEILKFFKTKSIKMKNQMIVEKIKKKFSEKIIKKWSAKLVDQKYDFTTLSTNVRETENQIWVQRRKSHYPYPHLRYLKKTTLGEIIQLDFNNLISYLNQQECKNTTLYIEMLKAKVKLLKDLNKNLIGLAVY